MVNGEITRAGPPSELGAELSSAYLGG
jgi:hypothetical protein